jgi:GTP-binding protein
VGEPVAVSAIHGLGVGELLDRLVALLPDAPRIALEEATEPRFALVGRPNVGKSSLFNRLVEEERSVVFEEAGTTRDAVDAVVRWQDVVVRFVDTAGFRRGSKVKSVEYFSLLRAERAIERADVAVLILDATDGLAAEDKRVAAKVMEAGRGLLVVANKWDLVEERDRTYKELGERVNVFARASVARTSARSGLGVHRLPPLLLGVRERWSRRVPTSEVNRVLQDAVAERPVPGGGRLKYATQVSAGPPTFVLFGARGPDASYQRFLEGRLRAAFGFDGVPIRLRFRAPRGRARHGAASE